MTNLDKWMAYTDGLPTPNNMCEWGFISLIASSLQRRVWLGPDHKPIYSNNYVVLVSPPGVGKSLIIDEVQFFIKFWKHGDNSKLLDAKFDKEEHKVAVECIQESDQKKALVDDGNDIDSDISKPALIPLAADATTYQALILAFGKCFRRISFKTYSEDLGKDIIGNYGHSSLCFCLKELGSLLAKKTEGVVIFMLGMYDCPIDFEYDTVNRKKDKVRRGWLNMLAATNPEFMNELFDTKLIDNAFLSRTIFVYAHKNRKTVDEIPQLSPLQKQYGIDLRAHILRLTTLYGLAYYSEETRAWIKEWFIKHEEHPELHSSTNPKLKFYKSRKLLHMKKTAMCFHFGESTEMEIPLSCFQKAVEFLDKEEKFMHLALILDAKDKTGIITKKIQEILYANPMTFVDISCSVFQSLGMVDKKSLQEALDFLDATGQVLKEVRKDSDTGNEVIYWRMK